MIESLPLNILNRSVCMLEFSERQAHEVLRS